MHNTPTDIDLHSVRYLEISLSCIRLLCFQHDNIVCSFQYGNYIWLTLQFAYRMLCSISSEARSRNIVQMLFKLCSLIRNIVHTLVHDLACRNSIRRVWCHLSSYKISSIFRSKKSPARLCLFTYFSNGTKGSGMLSRDFVLRERCRGIQITGHSASDNLNNFGASIILLGWMLRQRSERNTLTVLNIVDATSGMYTSSRTPNQTSHTMWKTFLARLASLGWRAELSQSGSSSCTDQQGIL